MAALAGIDLQRRCAGGTDARGIVVGLLVALDHGERMRTVQGSDGFYQQGGLAGAGAGHQIEREDAARRQVTAVLIGIAVVLGEDVALDLHHARMAHAGRMRACRSRTRIDRVMYMAVRMNMRHSLPTHAIMHLPAGFARSLNRMACYQRLADPTPACSTHICSFIRLPIP